MGCPSCGEPRARGVLCARCAEPLTVPPGLLPAHVVSRTPPSGGWLIDPFGLPHALVEERTLVGRQSSAELTIHNASVSRDHAELRKTADGWQLRDLGSRNGTFVDATRVQGRARVAPGALVRFGDVGFRFLERPAIEPPAAISIETGHAGAGVERYLVAGPVVELCLIGNSGGEDAGMGVLLHRARGAATWSEINLPRLEHELLQLLCKQAVDDAGSESRSRGAFMTKALARKLHFQTRYPNEENVRQVVKRLRASLATIGAEEALGAIQGRGYYVVWPVTAS